VKKVRPAPPLLKLNIAGGQQRMDGWTNIDIAKIPETDIVHDLNVMPWPLKDNSVEEALCSHYVEHIPTLCACCSGKQNPFFAFLDELYRIMIPGGKVTVISPYWSSIRCWQDPTHTRGISEYTFLYANAKWRMDNKLNHYPVHADFDFTYVYSMDAAFGQRAQDAQQFALRHYTNVVSDIQVFLVKR
jgi:predicted SAM-dependent methyltransferase